MRRLTRGIGLFGGAAATMTAKRIKLPTAKAERIRPDGDDEDDKPVAPEKPDEATEEQKGWLSRLFGSDDDPRK